MKNSAVAAIAELGRSAHRSALARSRHCRDTA